VPTKIIAIAGPTASGKTALSIELAKRLNGEIVSSDSMQIYRGMEIGTAAPTEKERAGIPHHMLGIAEPQQMFSCADYVSRARACIEDIRARGKMPILCGGTGLYLDSLLRVDFSEETDCPGEIRASLQALAEREGAEILHQRLAKVDPEAAQAIHPNNVRRVIRALEIYESTGIPKTEWDRRSLTAEKRYDVFTVVLNFLDREMLYRRIDARVTLMLEDGLEEEARRLWEAGVLDGPSAAAQAIGYKELVPYFNGAQTLEEAADQIRLSSRRYAKRQLTWFRRYTDALWLYPDGNGDGMLKSAGELAGEAVAAMTEKNFL